MDSDRTQRWGLAAALGAAFAASACCTLPLLLAAIGIGGAFASSFAVLEPYRPAFVVLSVAALAFAFWRSGGMGGRAEAEGPDCDCETAKRSRARWAALAGVALVVIALLAAPTLLSTQPAPFAAQPISLASEQEVLIRIEGMTCAACARGVEASLGRLSGVSSVAVTMEPPEARIRYDEAVTTPEALADAIEAQGYEAEIVTR